MNYRKADNEAAEPYGTTAWRGRSKIAGAVIMLALIGVFYLLREHWMHIAGYWPYLLLLACPLMHLLHGHGGHGHHASGPRDR